MNGKGIISMKQKIELLYVWIKNDSKNCFVNQGFNFSPSFSIKYNNEKKTIDIIKNNSVYNIFKRDNILNISAVVGENGSGKTTLLNYVTSLLSGGLGNKNDDDEDYGEHYEKGKLENTYITVYLVDDEIKIINHTDINIKYNNTSIPKYDVNADQEQIEQSISRIFISNSEYSINSNLRGYGRVNYITLTNNSLQSIGKEFYEHISGEHTLHSISDKIKDYFQGIQDVIINYKKENQNNGQKLQSILDIIFYSRIHKSNKKFLGKDVKSVKVGVLNLINILKDYCRDRVKRKDEFAEYINKFTTYFDEKWTTEQKNRISILKKNYIVESCVVNAFSIDEFNDLDLDSAYKLCFEKNKGNDKYYEVAKREVDGFLNMLSEEKFCHNLLPASDLAYTEWFEIEIDKMGEFFENIYKNQDGLSFASKYLVLCDDGFRGLESLKMSSGERALLNIFSRIELCDYLSRIQKNDFKLNDNIMLLLDELDLYLHPEWQRNMITKIIDELKEIYPNKNIQIIFSTHSPLMLSDVPQSNILWLKPDEKKVNLDNQTFGANIYDLYKNDFFLNSFIGEFAKSEIDKLIKEIYVLYKEVLEYKIEKLNGNSDKCEQIKLKMLLTDNINEKIADMKRRVSIIGDKIILHKLNQMIEEIEGVLNNND